MRERELNPARCLTEGQALHALHAMPALQPAPNSIHALPTNANPNCDSLHAVRCWLLAKRAILAFVQEQPS